MNIITEDLHYARRHARELADIDVAKGTRVLIMGISYEGRGRPDVFADSFGLAAAYDFAAGERELAETNMAWLASKFPDYKLRNSGLFSQDLNRRSGPLKGFISDFRNRHGNFDRDGFLALFERIKTYLKEGM